MTKYDIDVNDKEQIEKVLNYDIIKRNRYLNVILKYLENLSQNTIIALDGDWGSGKTVFLKEIEYLINDEINNKNYVKDDILNKIRENYMAFYFNAWENDDSPNALSSIILSIINKYDLNKDEKVLNAVKNVLNCFTKVITNGNVDIKNDFTWENNDILISTKKVKEEKQIFNSFIDEIVTENKNRILIIIDEIDRCKPEFAISVLETVKHLFTDYRITFLMGTNNKELGHVVCKVYGDNYDGYGYLDKFFDYQFSLPNTYIDLYVEYLYKTDARNYYKNLIPSLLIKKFNLTMREANRYYSIIKSADSYFDSMYQEKIDYTYFSKYLFAPLALILKVKNKKKYYKFIEGNAEELIEIFTENEFVDIVFNLFDHSRELSKKITPITENSNLSDDIKKNKRKIVLKEFLLNMYRISFQKNNNYLINSNINELIDMISMQGGGTI